MIDPVTGTLIAQGISTLGGIASNASAKAQSREQMKFQERMSSTAYQRAVKDMRAAGLNPALAYDSGGASSPVGSSAPVDNVLAGVAGSASAASKLRLEYAMMKSQTAKNDAERALLGEQKEKTRWDAASSKVNYEVLKDSAGARRDMAGLDRDVLRLSIPQLQRSADAYSGSGGAALTWLQPFLDALGGGVNAYAKIRGGVRPDSRR